MELASTDIGSLVYRLLSENPAEQPASESFRYSKASDILLSALPKGGSFSPLDSFAFDTANVVAAEGMARWLDPVASSRGQWDGGRSAYRPGADSRYIIAPGSEAGQLVVVILDPQVGFDDSRRLTGEIDFHPGEIVGVMDEMRDAARAFQGRGQGGLQGAGRQVEIDVLAHMKPTEAANLVWEIKPEVLVTHLPKMVPLCAPRPHISLQSGGQVSTAGIFCRDADGELGITGCYHGTGAVGTDVTVGLRSFKVKHADAVQDIVFIPLGKDYNVPDLVGIKGPVANRAPGQGDNVRFEGSTSGDVSTRIASYDAGLLRRRATVQLKLQTRPDANAGDSGAALIDDDDHVLAFAFERTDYGDFPEFTDWIWADNALAALGLTPVK